MAGFTLTKLGFHAGIWEGRLVAGSKSAKAPQVEVHFGDDVLAGVLLRPDGKGAWLIAVPIPAEGLGDGISGFLVVDTASEAEIASFCIAAGSPLDGDLRAEVNLLRAELELLKKAFRRQVSGG